MFSLKKGLFDFILAGVLVMLLQENREMKERREKELRAANDNDRIDHFNLQITELKKELEYMHDENRTLIRKIESLKNGYTVHDIKYLKDEISEWRKKYTDERERTLQLETENEKLKNEWVEKTVKADGYV